MEAKNLRIGNLLNRRNRFGEIEQIEICGISARQNVYDEDDSAFGCDELIPIKLTKELVINLGFRWSTQFNWFEFKQPYLLLKKDFSLTEDPYGIRITLEYVHELQNFFFALTGIELELKNETSTCG